MRSTMTSTLTRGLLAGTVGTALLNVVTFADMALTNRPPSTAPEQTVTTSLRRAGRSVPGDNRITGLGALAGIATGVGIGVAVSVARTAGIRLPGLLGGPVIGLATMAATDIPMAALGVSDPRTWTAADWTRDVVPHLAYGLGVHSTLEALEPSQMPDGVTALTPAPRGRGRFGLLGRSLALGLASGGRSSLALVPSAMAARRPPARAATAAAVAGEMVVDKLPSTPSRVQTGPLLGRWAAGAFAGYSLARRDRANVVLPTVVGLAGAGVGAVLGTAWREVASQWGWTWQAGLVEDGVWLTLGLRAAS
jgi:hypothetical protein